MIARDTLAGPAGGAIVSLRIEHLVGATFNVELRAYCGLRVKSSCLLVTSKVKA